MTKPETYSDIVLSFASVLIVVWCASCGALALAWLAYRAFV